MGPKPRLFLIAAPPDLRREVESVARTVGMDVTGHADAEEFLEKDHDQNHYGCVLLASQALNDQQAEPLLTSLSGRWAMPIIVVIGGNDMATAMRVLTTRHACDVVESPLHAEQLLDKIKRALSYARQSRRECRELADVAHRCGKLKNGEHEIFAAICQWTPLARIARDKGMGERDLRLIRDSVLLKLELSSPRS